MKHFFPLSQTFSSPSLSSYGQVIRGITFFFLQGSGQSFTLLSADRLIHSLVSLSSSDDDDDGTVLSVLMISTEVLLFEPQTSGEDLSPLLKVFEEGFASGLETEVREFSFIVLRSKLMHDASGFRGLDESVDGVNGDINLGRAFSTGSGTFFLMSSSLGVLLVFAKTICFLVISFPLRFGRYFLCGKGSR